MLTLTVRGGQLRLLIAQGQKVLWFRVVPLNPAFLEGGVIARPDGVAASVIAALQLGERHGVKRCVAALPGFHSQCEMIDLPQAREARPEEVLPREARRLFSFRPDSSTLSWWRVPEGGVSRRYAMVITRTAALYALQEVARLAKLRLVAVDSGPLALARATNSPDGIAVQAESDGCEIVVLKEGRLGLVRSAFWGAEVIDPDTLAARVVDLVERSVATHNDGSSTGPLSGDSPIYLAGAAAEALGPQ
ncbi:MAG: hypothetical protein HW388_694, partial [Dehalococcoidia bacterium]|nr:hypothetical protein [Dehalococcoidia bacterium]